MGKLFRDVQNDYACSAKDLSPELCTHTHTCLLLIKRLEVLILVLDVGVIQQNEELEKAKVSGQRTGPPLPK
jgi:hypothetical protein